MTKYREFWLLFALVFATRFADFVHAQPYRSELNGSYGRMYEMEASADQIARTGRMSDVFTTGSGPSAHVAPLYAGYLALIDRAVGLDVGRFRFVQGLGSILATALFASLLPGFASRAGLRPSAGLLAGLMVALAPFGLWLEIRGDWETAFLPLGLLAIFWALMTLQEHGWADRRLTLVTGVLFGLGGLLSPVILLAGLAGLFAQGVDPRVRKPRLFVAGGVVLVVGALTVAPWVYRNYLCFHSFVPIRDNFGIELAVGNNPLADGATFGGGMSVHPLANPSELARLRDLGEVPYNRVRLGEATGWIKANPTRFVRLSLTRLIHFWFPHNQAMLGPLPLLTIPRQAIVLCGVSVLGFVGLSWLVKSGHRNRALFVAILLSPSLPYLITHVSYRYRYPINGFLFLLASEALVRGVGRIRGRDDVAVAKHSSNPSARGDGFGPGGDDGFFDGRVVVH